MFYEFLHFLKAEMYQINKFRALAPKMAKTSVLELLDSPKLISRKIWMIEKSWNFHTVTCWSAICLQNTMLHKLSKCEVKSARYRYFSNLLPLRFYVKSNFDVIKRSKNGVNSQRWPSWLRWPAISLDSQRWELLK